MAQECQDVVPEGSVRGRVRPSRWTYAACLIVGWFALSWPYWPSLWAFFENDDWLLLDVYGRTPPWQFWKFFSPQVVWYYRPAQSLLYSVLYHLFGLHALPYTLSLFAMHFVFIAVAYLLLRVLGASRTLCSISLSFFAVSWVYSEALMWKANFGTLQSAIAAVLPCLAFAWYLAGRGRLWKIAANALVVAGLFTRETAVFVPVLLLLVWGAMRLWNPASPFANRRDAVRDAVAVLWFPSVACAVFSIWHQLFVRNILVDEGAGYSMVGLPRALFQCLFVYKYSLLAFYHDRWVLPHLPLVRDLLGWIWGPLIALPLLLLLLGVRFRDRFLLFGILWLLTAFLPTVLLERFNVGRYYYLPMLGGALIQARLLLMVWDGCGRLKPWARRVVRWSALAILAHFVVANWSVTWSFAWAVKEQSAVTRDVFRFLSSQRDQVAPDSLVFMRPPEGRAIGCENSARGFVRFALDMDRVEGHVQGEGLSARRKADLEAIGKVYTVDMTQGRMRLIDGGLR